MFEKRENGNPAYTQSAYTDVIFTEFWTEFFVVKPCCYLWAVTDSYLWVTNCETGYDFF